MYIEDALIFQNMALKKPSGMLTFRFIGVYNGRLSHHRYITDWLSPELST